MVVVERWANAKTFVVAEVPQFTLARIVVNDDGLSDGAYRCIKGEQPVLVLPG